MEYTGKALLKDIYYLKCKFGSSWSTVVVIKNKKSVFLIDSGPKDAVENEILPWFKKNDIDVNDIHMIINTHSHGDHIGGNYDLKKINTGILIASHKLAVNKIKNPYMIAKKIRSKFSDYITAPSPDKISGVDVDIPLKDGDVVEIEGLKFNIFHTPGHDTECICIYEPKTKTLFTGDSIQGGGTKSSGIAFYQDLSLYRKSIKKIKALEIENLVLGHPYYPSNGIIQDKDKVKEFLDLSLNHTYNYDREILKILGSGTKDLLEITRGVVGAVGSFSESSFNFLSFYTINAHLSNMFKDKKVSYYVKDGKYFWKIL